MVVVLYHTHSLLFCLSLPPQFLLCHAHLLFLLLLLSLTLHPRSSMQALGFLEVGDAATAASQFNTSMQVCFADVEDSQGCVYLPTYPHPMSLMMHCAMRRVTSDDNEIVHNMYILSNALMPCSRRLR